ncbi:hypothetical protein LTR62_006369 [Meristemomyces frigidus]|uniref:DUF572-domain-containing protein n=1 Tax=Meristemomyces frigidus TaxID=1508187 RepID=A0AAN7TCF7_9PEZI|nr:hypothetical protein LTR62_006369 [Meristemomyces frigidus]
MQGFNMGRYIPPDQVGLASANQIHKKRAPGTLSKDGTQTVRFEMPFAVWCHNCKPHAIIGQGVRFNATKKHVGWYYSTKIWTFGLKHSACGGTIEIRTDPKTTTYVVVSGGKARDYGEDRIKDEEKEGSGGAGAILTEAERERRREDAFANLEGRVEEKMSDVENGKRTRELYRDRSVHWGDPWSGNKNLRESFRRERKVREREGKATEALKLRLGTDIDILPETEEDGRRAKLVEFGVGEEEGNTAAADKPLFAHNSAPPSLPKQKILPLLPWSRYSRTSSPTVRTRVEMATGKKKDSVAKDALRRRLLGQTRAGMMPFG